MPEVRTTLMPDKVLVVDEREAYGLRQNGLLIEDDKAPAQDPSAAPHKDADEVHDETNKARREELGETKGQAKTGRAKTEEK